MKVEVKKTVLGKIVVAYDCPSCGERLRSPSEDVSKSDTCPTCGVEFRVPGRRELAEIRRIERQEEETRQAEQARQEQVRVEQETLKQAEREARLASAQQEKARREAEKLEKRLKAAERRQMFVRQATGFVGRFVPSSTSHRLLVTIALLVVISGAVVFGVVITGKSSKSDVVQQPEKPAVKTTEEIVAECEGSVAFIEGRSSSGTGFLIGPGLLATNRHVIDEVRIENLAIHFPSAPEGLRGPLDAELVYRDMQADFAILAVKTSLPALKCKLQHEFRRGQDVLAIGNPGFFGGILRNAVSRGVMSSQTEIDGQHFDQLGISINPGNSGGPVLDYEGNVVGMITLKARQEGIAFSVPTSEIQRAIREAASMTSEEIDLTRKLHTGGLLFGLIEIYGQSHLAYLDDFNECNRVQSKYKVDVSGIKRDARIEYETSLGDWKDSLPESLLSEIADFISDERIPEDTRNAFSDLWTNCEEARGYVHKEMKTASSKKSLNRFDELSAQRAQLLQTLKTKLGVME